MSWDTLFSLTNGWAMIGWLMLIALPRAPFVKTFIMYAVVGLLCLAYAVMFGMLLSGSVDAGAVPGAGQPGFGSVDGVMALFDSRGGAAIGWTHYLAFDLFVGLWIATDADNKHVHRLWQVPILILTLLAGPVGLLIWLIVREPRARAEAKARRG